jgi:hypothetical protein
MANKKINLYCPKCADRVDRDALALDFNERITCKSCSAVTRAGKLLTDERRTLVDYLAEQTSQMALGNKRPNA